jgi:hypothetical protein
VTPFFWTTCFFFLARGLRYRKPLDWVLAGLAGGLGECGYYGTRLLPFILVRFSAFLLIRYPGQARTLLGYVALLALGYLAAFGPLLAYFTTHPDLYFVRGEGALIWDHIPRSWSDLQLMWATLKPPLVTNLLAISTIPDNGSFYWAPLLLPAEAALLVLGVALLIRACYEPVPFLLLISGVGTLFVGGTLVAGAPQLQHWTPAFPAMYAAMALPVGAWLYSLTLSRSRWPRRVGLVGVALGLGLLGWHNIDFYFRQYQATRPEFEIRAEQSRWEAALGSNYRVRTVGRSWQDYNADYNRLLIQSQDGAALDDPATELPLAPAYGKGMAFVFFGDEEQYLPAVRALYPGGRGGEVRSHGGIHLFYTYVLTPAQMQADEGVTLDVTPADNVGCHWRGRVDRIGNVPAQLRTAAHARWSGLLFVPRAGTYRLALVGRAARMRFDMRRGSEVAGPLSRGWHRIEVEASVPAAQPLHLTLAEAGAPAREVPPAMLWPAALNMRITHDGRNGPTTSSGAAAFAHGCVGAAT